MSYNKLGFTSGQTLKAEHLNHMEEGIANAGGASWDNITDKPSYLPVIECAFTEILPETQLIFDEGSQQFLYTEPVEGIKAGGTYIITYNGVEYTCNSMEYPLGDVTCIALGNMAGDENGAPCVAIIVPPEMVAEAGIGLMMYVFDGVTEVTIAIRDDNPTYTKKLDNNCLDLDWMPIKKTNPYKEYKEEMVVAHEAVIGDGSNFSISEVVSYEVSFDGVTYYVPGIYRSLGAVRTETYIGNRKLYNLYLGDEYGHLEDTDEPFLIRTYYGPEDDRTDKTTFYAADGGEHTISISILLNDINKMPECYMPESVSGIVVRSSTLGSTKKFKLTVDDSGTVTAKEITA